VIWSTWRQHRWEALAGLAVLVAAVVAVLSVNSAIGLGRRDTAQVQDLVLALFALPLLVGMFVGAPLLARDFEQGTHRLVWTQGMARSRWLRGKLLLVFASAGAGAVLLGAVVMANVTLSVPHDEYWTWFDVQLPVFAAYVLFALALGIALGAVIGRTYPAMALTLVLYVAARGVVEGTFRPQYQAPMRIPVESFATIDVRGIDFSWSLGVRYFDASGHELSFNDTAALMNSHSQLGPNLAAHGLTGWAYYQPWARFWPLQGIETAVFLALAALLVGLAYYWTTRRVT
jgi:hypothetical protein